MDTNIILLPQNPKIVKKVGPNRAVFEIEGLYPGYGLTVGNALRRVLLSSLEGAAITSVKIKGANHEFTTINNVLEDVVELILNLKQIDFKLEIEGPVTVTLKVKGEKKVTAGDIDVPSGAMVANPEVHIATLTAKGAALEIEMQVEKGLGYWPVESRKKEKSEVGVIPIDAIFTPIKHINYEVENMRVGDRTDYNLLRLDIETDGSITPEEALQKSAEILIDHFKTIAQKAAAKEKETQREVVEKKEEKGTEATEAAKDISKMKVDDLKLSNRTLNALTENHIKTVAGILKNSEEDLKSLEGLGEKGIKEIRKALGKYGLTLGQ